MGEMIPDGVGRRLVWVKKVVWAKYSGDCRMYIRNGRKSGVISGVCKGRSQQGK